MVMLWPKCLLLFLLFLLLLLLLLLLILLFLLLLLFLLKESQDENLDFFFLKKIPQEPLTSVVDTRACERSWAVRIPAPRSRGCSLPRSTAQSYSRPLRSFPLPAHLQFHPAPVKSLHARSHLKFLCMPNTCRFQPKPWDTLSAWRTWSGFVA